MLDQISLYPGMPSPLGFSVQDGLANFAIFSSHASNVILGLKKEGKVTEIALNRSQNVWHIGIGPLDENWEYAFRVDGPNDPSRGYLFDAKIWLADPRAQTPSTPIQWGIKEKSIWSKCRLPQPFDWENIKKPKIPFSDLVIYEMHVRGFTRHSSSNVSHPGTFLGIIEKIPYLKTLGINAVELMPIFEFDETHCKNCDPNTKASLVNYWGYSPLFFFAPMRRYACDDAIKEFKTLIKTLHANGIEVILDVVYNHTGEGKATDSRCHFRGLDNPVYYMVDETGRYRDFTGCDNTFNSNHPIVAQLILDSLIFWVEEMQVDGFRFDLAAVHVRGVDGRAMKHPPLLEAIAKNPVLQETKFIAEGWDASGLYMVGSFPHFGPWTVWNGQFRDQVRNFIKGTDGACARFGDVISGSEFLYEGYGPLRSINFITAHDGFSLSDLVSYNQKHNLSNGEKGKDGNNQNLSWNCGVEGPTQDPNIRDLRERQKRNFLLSLFLAQGVPMLLMGDEYGHTRKGNNNPYVQDNEINWFLWDELEKNRDIFDFVANLIAFRKTHSSLRRCRFLRDADISWHGIEPNSPDWSESNRFVAYTLHASPSLYIAFNADFREKQVTLPEGPWIELICTKRPWKEHNLKLANRDFIKNQSIKLIPYSAVVLIAPF